jgi:hypothetical protein
MIPLEEKIRISKVVGVKAFGYQRSAISIKAEISKTIDSAPFFFYTGIKMACFILNTHNG